MLSQFQTQIDFRGSKAPFLLSLLSYLFSGNDDFREERRTKREKLREQKNDNLLSKIVVSFWCGQQDSNLHASAVEPKGDVTLVKVL